MTSRETHLLSEDELVRRNLPLVHYAVAEIAARIPRHVSHDDLVSAGMAGLVKAAKGFDHERGVGFDRYAATRIRGALLDELRAIDWASRTLRARARRISGAVDDLQSRHGRAPSTAEVAKHVGLHKETVDAVAGEVHRAVVLNYDSIAADESTGEELLPPNDQSPDVILLDREQRSYLHDAIDALPQKLRYVIENIYFGERSAKEIAKELGVTDARVSQMRSEAQQLIREALESELDTDGPRRTGGSSKKAEYFAAMASNSNFSARLDLATAERRSHFATDDGIIDVTDDERSPH